MLEWRNAPNQIVTLIFQAYKPPACIQKALNIWDAGCARIILNKTCCTGGEKLLVTQISTFVQRLNPGMYNLTTKLLEFSSIKPTELNVTALGIMHVQLPWSLHWSFCPLCYTVFALISNADNAYRCIAGSVGCPLKPTWQSFVFICSMCVLHIPALTVNAQAVKVFWTLSECYFPSWNTLGTVP